MVLILSDNYALYYYYKTTSRRFGYFGATVITARREMKMVAEIYVPFSRLSI